MDVSVNSPEEKLGMPPAEVLVEKREDGSLILTSPIALGDYDTQVGDMLRRWAAKTPDQILFAERDGEGEWRRVTYGEVREAADSIAQAMIDRGMGPDRPLMILSPNSIEHGMLTLGAMQAGVPVVPVSVAYSLMSEDFGKLKHVFGLVEPGMIFVQNGEMFSKALGALDLSGVEVVVNAAPPAGIDTTFFGELLEVTPGPAVEEAYAAVGPDSVAKYLFTSGSTGMPKGVINTQRMLCSNRKSVELVWPFLMKRPSVMVDWLPWNHTFGGNANFNSTLYTGGAIYIDGGKPAPGLIEQTVQNLREIAPTAYYNVPAGFNMLLPFLEQDDELAQNFFSELDVIFYAAAAMPQEMFDRVVALSTRVRGTPVAMTTGWGSTETAPVASMNYYPLDRSNNIGLPLPGIAIKLAPTGDKMELRVKGPNITPGYLKQPDLAAEMLDEEGFYFMGDAGKLQDPNNPEKGLVFDGRVAEDFKLQTGTWVSAGMLRVAALGSAAPLLRDAVVAGQDKEWVGLLAWVNVDACRELCSDPAAAEMPEEELYKTPDVVNALREKFAVYNKNSTGSSTRIKRLMLLTEPASIDANEITDKGYVNQNAVLSNRADLVARLYADEPGDDVIVV